MGYTSTRRHSVEILLEILENAKKPLPATRLMLKANMGWTPFKKMVAFLVEKEFLEKLPPPEPKNRTRLRGRRIKELYRTTLKGYQALKLVEGSVLAELFEYGREEVD